MITPQAVIDRYSVEELLETAEEYYRRIDDATPLMSKPFAFLHEAPEMLQNLGALLSGLQLGKTMSVLDFGGGTGWLSRFLIQLNCQAICCDASSTALEIGERLFREYPPVGPVVYRPRFLLFDGRKIALAHESVDRIICFDAFHHVPNQAEVLGEFARVLKPGGIVGFSEPGRQHSSSHQSQYEMQNHRVLENDIKVNDIFALAKPAGFTRLSLRVATDMEMSLEEHETLLAPPHGAEHERLRSELWNQTFNTMTNRAVFFLHKGPLVRDSRSHVGLAHQMATTRPHVNATVGIPIEISFDVSNTGDATWLDRNDEIFGIVRLGAHLYSATGELVSVDFFRHDLPRRVAPGERVQMTVPLTMPSRGQYRLGFDLVAEGVAWFAVLGSSPVYVEISVS